MILTGLIVPVLIEVQRKIIDTAANYSSEGNILIVISSFLIAYLVFYYIDTISNQIKEILNLKIINDIEKNTMKEYLENISKIDFQSFENSETQNILMRIMKTIKKRYYESITFFPSIIKSFIELGGIFYFVILSEVWWAFPLGILISLPSFYFNKKRIQLARTIWIRDSFDIRYNDYLNDVLLNREAAKERRFFGFTNYLSDFWKNKFEQYNKDKIRKYVKVSLSTGIAMCFSMSIILILGIFLLKPLQEGVITIGLYTALLVAVTGKMNMAISAVIREYTILIDAKHFLEDLSKIENVKKINFNKEKINTKIDFENIVFEDVWFKYPNTNNYILKGVSFKINKNERHALIGINGSGKTTITKLMLGLYSPNRGTIYINNKKIESYSYNEIQTLYANIQQNFAKYKETLKENIGLYNLSDIEIKKESLYDTLKKCETLDILDKCKNDYETILSPEFTGGIMLSGGEWQKVALSRAFYSKREFIIFDEPTAALDPLAEINFYKIYNKIMKGHTCLFITHRLGSTYLFENCFVLNDGIIVEKGSHEELMKNNEVYKKLYDKQKKWYEDTEVIQNKNI